MKKQLIVINLLFTFFMSLGQQTDKTINDLSLLEDENVKITLKYFSKADIGDDDWLKLEIENKTSFKVQIVELNFNINQEKQLENGNKYSEVGAFGRGSMYDLIHYFLELPNPSANRNDAYIDSKSSILAWKYLTNNTSILIDGRNFIENKVSATFQLDFQYELNEKKIKISCENKPFSFEWTNSKYVDVKKLENRLRESILDSQYKNANTNVLLNLSSKLNILNRITTEELIQGVLLRENVTNSDPNSFLLSELKNRNAVPDERVTNSFRKRIVNNDSHVADELHYYWDNKLIDDLVKSKLEWSLVHRIFEINSNSWSTNSKYNKKIFGYLSSSLMFEKSDYLQPNKINEWSKNVKIIATSRDVEIIEYLKKFLDNESQFKVEDWSKYRSMSALPKEAKPDTITLKVCDVAFVALLRALNQLNFLPSNKIGTKQYIISINQEFLDPVSKNTMRGNINPNDLNLSLFEKIIKLTPDLKNKIEAKILSQK